jgi:tetratricopeptide (TPR) repeat protein
VKILRLDEVEGIPVLGTLVWKPVRKPLGITAFGVNAYTAANAGDEVVEDHDETRLGHEEIYVVLNGRATFTVDGEEVDAPAGTIVYLDDPAQQRAARAVEPGTTVLAVGGVPGKHEISAWEYFFEAAPLERAGEWDKAEAMIREGLAAKPENPALLYHLARADANRGRVDEAFEHLNAAIAQDDWFGSYAEKDEFLAPIRDDPRFPGQRSR